MTIYGGEHIRVGCVYDSYRKEKINPLFLVISFLCCIPVWAGHAWEPLREGVTYLDEAH